MTDIYNELRGAGEENVSAERKTLDDWQKDREEMKRLLRVGRRVAERKIGKLLKVHEDRTVEGEDPQECERDKDFATDLFRNTAGSENGIPMGKTLEYAERGVRKMLKGVPTEIE